MHAVRLASGFTGRDVIVKFEGTYHGAHDYVMFSTPGNHDRARSRVAVPADTDADELRHARRRSTSADPDAALQRSRRRSHGLFADQGNRIAALVVEPMLGNAMGIEPDPGFLEGLRDLCDGHGSILIFDEVKTGFRIAVGGAAETYGVTPDISTFAKALGNGVPVAAIAGRGAVLDGWAKGGIVAGRHVLRQRDRRRRQPRRRSRTLMTGEPMAQLDRVGSALMEGTAKILADQGVPSDRPGQVLRCSASTSVRARRTTTAASPTTTKSCTRS